MGTDTEAEIHRLRAVLRDLVALSTIPATWIGHEPPEVAARLADTLIGLLTLDFAFVRLCDPGGDGGSVDVARGSAWPGFGQWLDDHVATNGALSGNAISCDIATGPQARRGVVLPIGVDAEGGFVAAARDRSDFPSELDQLLLSLAANHAAAAFRSARLIHERRTVEEELRDARDGLERTVAARTAQLRRSEAHLAEGQRLSHTGSFALQVPDGVPTHSSAEHSRLYGFAPGRGVPSRDEFLQRIHPEDRERCAEALERAIRDGEELEIDHRVVHADGEVRHLRALAHPAFGADGALEELVGTVMDVTDAKRAEDERRAQLWFFESMDGVNRAMQGTRDLGQMMGDVLDVALTIFGCDRAWLIYPCDPEAASHRVRMERTRPEYPGAVGLGVEIPNDAEVAELFRTALASGRPVRSDPGSGRAPPSDAAERFAIRSQIVLAVHPKVDKPYMFGLHQCSYARVWTAREERLFEAIGRRLVDALDTLVMFRDLREARRQVEESRDELRALADEQAALRRVATLVAQTASPSEVFESVTREVGMLCGADLARMERHEPDGVPTRMAEWRRGGDPARDPAPGITATVGCPIVVEGRLWGEVIASSTRDGAFPDGTESQIAGFTHLVATAIANAESRAELIASRARVVVAADQARRLVVRDLHDGAQQRLIHTVVALKMARQSPREDEADALIAEALEHAERANAELRELAHGIHPSSLIEGGLRIGVDALVSRLAVPVAVDVSVGRLARPIEACAYFVVAEALTNVVKHSDAGSATVAAWVEDGALHLEVGDDGMGGARAGGPGLVGLADRLAAVGGRLRVVSPSGGGTRVAATVPLP